MRGNRRKFLAAALGSGAALGWGALAARKSGEAKAGKASDAVTRTSRALGSEVSLTILGLPRERCEAALDAAFGELETVEAVMSLYRPQSQICRLNRERVLHDPHPYLVAVLRAAQKTSRKTEGAFDITVQPLWLAFAHATQADQLPAAAEIEAARQGVDWRQVLIRPDRIELARAETQITLNGIAQGFAADCATRALRQHGVEHALINTGEIGCLGRKSGGTPWTIGIQHPRATDAYLALAGLDGRSLATSGDYETAFSADFRANHIFDPRSGTSPRELASVSVVAPTAMQADALSTAFMVLGGERSLQLISSLPRVDALLAYKDGRTIATAGFPEASPAT